ncbi:GntR family transcriptional regulator [Roseibacterium sp. SDUM158016]|uniref:GntR family transcriptional regulator n=1 Tax=Roseicyclus sediminis TaxID=2980997 RepID=UPI0021D1BB6F|nr:GntR family transcriptional regulator [Roseibacterium sp. SDUM158016]MCU4653726.1 GntR family transcriptional regulator [Roseibacterium sp. SDUM158016]
MQSETRREPMAQDTFHTDASQGHDAYTRLLSEIRQGRLGPGDRLTETELAQRLGTSRTPVREAIRLLEADGLVTHTPRVGAVIRQLDYAEITELYEMRAVLEGTAARFAARAAYPSEIDEMAAINAEMAAAKGDVERLYEANRQFHDILRNAARNRFLLSAVQAVQKTLLILGPSTMEEGGRAEAAIAEHEALIAALRAHDGDAAEAAMRAHIEAAHRARQRQLRKRGRE